MSLRRGLFNYSLEIVAKAMNEWHWWRLRMIRMIFRRIVFNKSAEVEAKCHVSDFPDEHRRRRRLSEWFRPNILLRYQQRSHVMTSMKMTRGRKGCHHNCVQLFRWRSGRFTNLQNSESHVFFKQSQQWLDFEATYTTTTKSDGEISLRRTRR